jgi:hypothetical protein
LAKQRFTRFESVSVSTLEQVCSVSECIASTPPMATYDGRNHLGFYDSEDDARATVSADEVADYELFAFGLLPEGFCQDSRRALPDLMLRGLDGIDLTGWTSLGFDVVADCPSYSFLGCCSPLTCNGLVDRVATNRWGLMESLQQAVDLAEALALDRMPAEPGPFFVVEVLRR